MGQTYDLAIIGGGINGCGIARDAAGRGMSVFLCEMNDLASGTSSWSTKLIHGGLRYLEYFEFRLVREALAEREVLWRIAPHIIHPLRFVLPHRKGLRPAWLLRLGLFLYDHLGDKTRAIGLSERFMRRIIANLDNDWVLTSADIDRSARGDGRTDAGGFACAGSTADAGDAAGAVSAAGAAAASTRSLPKAGSIQHHSTPQASSLSRSDLSWMTKFAFQKGWFSHDPSSFCRCMPGWSWLTRIFLDIVDQGNRRDRSPHPVQGYRPRAGAA